MRLVGCGGAAVPLFVHEPLYAVGIPLLEARGLTEPSPVIALNGNAPGATRLGSVGRPLPSYQPRLAAGRGAPRAPPGCGGRRPGQRSGHDKTS